MRYLIAVFVLLVGAGPSYAAGCAVWIDHGRGFFELVNVCLDPEVRALMEVRSSQFQRRVTRRPSVSAARRSAPYVATHSSHAKEARRSTSPEVIFVQEVPARPPTQAELEALVTSGPEPGKTWGIPVLPRVGEIR